MRVLLSAAAIFAMTAACGGTAREPVRSEVGPVDPAVERAAVRPAPADGFYQEALAKGVLRADPATGCLWLEQEDGTPAVELLLQGESYRLDLAPSPAAVLDGDGVVARVGDRVEVAGGLSDREVGVEGCPVSARVYLGHFER